MMWAVKMQARTSTRTKDATEKPRERQREGEKMCWERTIDGWFHAVMLCAERNAFPWPEPVPIHHWQCNCKHRLICIVNCSSLSYQMMHAHSSLSFFLFSFVLKQDKIKTVKPTNVPTNNGDIWKTKAKKICTNYQRSHLCFPHFLHFLEIVIELISPLMRYKLKREREKFKQREFIIWPN